MPEPSVRAPRRVHVEHMMGTVISVDVREPDVADVAIDEVFAWLRDVDARFSTYRQDSEISRLRRGDITPAQTSSDVRTVLGLCDAVCTTSGGVFDIWQGRDGGLDPSGLVKGWAIDRAVEILESFGARNFCINAGGDVVTRGEPEPGAPWRIGIRHPDRPDVSAAVIAARDLAVATSGTYERGEHIVDPRTGRPAGGLVSITVTGPTLALADAYATAAFAMGRSGVDWVASLDGYAVHGITDERRATWSPSFEALLVRGPTATVH